MTEEFNQYEHGVEIAPVGLRGYAVFTGSGGEDPTFHAFFVREADARHAIETRSDEPGEEQNPRLFDATYVLAILTERGVVASNDCAHKTHADLESAYARAVASQKEGS